jgi:hypothetical protein
MTGPAIRATRIAIPELEAQKTTRNNSRRCSAAAGIIAP